MCLSIYWNRRLFSVRPKMSWLRAAAFSFPFPTSLIGPCAQNCFWEDLNTRAWTAGLHSPSFLYFSYRPQDDRAGRLPDCSFASGDGRQVHQSFPSHVATIDEFVSQFPGLSNAISGGAGYRRT